MKASRLFVPRRFSWLLLLVAILLGVTLLGMAAYTGVGLWRGWGFEWHHFLVLIAISQSVNVLFLLVAWRVRLQLSFRAQIGILDWAALSVWFWLLGPLYHYMTITTNSLQLQLVAFIFFCEVPLVGWLFSLRNQRYLRPVEEYLRTGESADPVGLIARLDAAPRAIAVRALTLTVLGYTLGSLQLRYVAQAPALEAWKNFGNGVVLCLLIGLFYGLIFDRYFSGLKSKLQRQYDVTSHKTRFGNQIVLAVALIIISSLCMVVLLYVQSYQLVINEQLQRLAQSAVTKVVADPDTTNGIPSAARVDDLSFGERGRSWMLPADAPLPITDVAQETATAYNARRSGAILDLHHLEKIIVFQNIQTSKLGTVIYLTDFYTAIQGHIAIILGTTALVGLMAIGAAQVFIGLNSRVIARLIEAVERAKRTGKYRRPEINTSNEFESLSDAFGTFIGQTQERSEQLRQEQARLEASIEALSQGFIMTNSSGMVIARNASLASILGPQAAVATTVEELSQAVADEDAGRLSKMIQEVLAGHKHRREWHFNAVSGKVVKMYLTPIVANDQIIGLVLLAQDITEEMTTQRSRDEFFSIASHELRTPLTAIRGNASMIQNYYADGIKNPEIMGVLDDIHDSSVRLIQIVNDFLDMSRIEQGRMQYHLSDFGMNKLAQEVVHDLQPVGEKKQIFVEYKPGLAEGDDMTHADRDRTKQVLYNLLGNAVKFTEKGGVTVQIHQTDSIIRVTVSDTGGGISDDDQKLLFRKFQQANHSLVTRDPSGSTGLGLYISRMMAEGMGGHLQLDHSTQGKGTQFSVTLPKGAEQKN